jgi:chemotaxis protein MotB
MSKEIPPIIIKKIKKSDGHHGGAWKVAYADFVTAMMALFIVLWVLSQDQATRESISRYFKDPIGFSSKSKNMMDGGVKNLDEKSDDKKTREAEIDELKRMGERIISELAKNEEFAKISDQISIEIIDEGLRIELMENTEDVFFEIGTSALKPNAVRLMGEIGKYLATLPNQIVLEGHTDSRPYNGGSINYTNFELSTDRANAARKALLSHVSERQIHAVRGYADRILRDTNDPYNVTNRRISIIVRFKENESV